MNTADLSTLGLLTLEQAAARRNVHERTLRRWVTLGLRHFPAGGQERAGYLLFLAEDVDNWQPPRKAGAPKGNQNAAKKKKPRARKRKKS